MTVRPGAMGAGAEIYPGSLSQLARPLPNHHRQASVSQVGVEQLFSPASAGSTIPRMPKWMPVWLLPWLFPIVLVVVVVSYVTLGVFANLLIVGLLTPPAVARWRYVKNHPPDE